MAIEVTALVGFGLSVIMIKKFTEGPRGACNACGGSPRSVTGSSRNGVGHRPSVSSGVRLFL